MKNRAALLAASVLLWQSQPSRNAPRIVARMSNAAKRNTMSTDRMRLAPNHGRIPDPPSAVNHAPALPSRTAGKAGASTTCRT